MQLFGSGDGAAEASLPEWSSVLHAMPIPAALVRSTGEVLAANRWLDVEPGDLLLEPETGPLGATLRFGAQKSRWRVRPVEQDGSVLLATGEREDAGDHLLRKFFSSGDSLFVVYDQAGQIIQSNAAWEALLGYTSDQVFGLDSWTLLPEDDLETRDRVEKELRAFGRSEPTFQMRTADGSYRLVEWALHFDMSVGRCFGIGRDVTEQERVTAELEWRAFHDQLTGLANRARLVDRLGTVLEEGGSPALLFCDLDRFKVVNDSLGHQAGDALLTRLAGRLASIGLGPDALLARFGGDEFVLLLEDGDEDRATRAAEQLLACLEAPFLVAGRPIHVTMSIGISIAAGSPNRSADGLLDDADTAAYAAKSQGRERLVVFDERLRAQAKRRFDVEAGLRRAMRDGHIQPLFQPIVALPGGGIVGAEALVRWKQGDHYLSPGQFLDVAQDAGLMAEIGQIVADASIEAAAALAEAGRPLPLSINMSDAELKSPDICTWMAERVASAGLDPSSILIEITESAVLATDEAMPVLERLRSHGFRLGLDDFGTGFSSLAHLRELPINVVKVDRSFVADLVDDHVTRAVTASLVELCHALDLDVIMEGIETADQAAAVEQIGGSKAQGFLFHRPMPIEDLASLVTGGRIGNKRPPIETTDPARVRTRPAAAMPATARP